MKINARPLKGEAFDVEVEPGDTVQDLKAKVAALKPELPASQQKLVFSGKVLQDGATLSDSGIKDGDFLVIMVAKPKPAPGAAPSAASSAAPAAAAPAAPAPAPALAPAGAVAPAPAGAAPAAGMAGGPPPEATIAMLCDMGFPRSMVEQCLRAAFNNPDRAVEYLMSGVPPHLQALASGQAPPPAPTPAPAPAPAGGMPGMPGAAGQAPLPGFPPMPMAPGGAQATGPLAKLQNHPLFFRLKMAVQQNPGALNQVLSVINQADPSLIQVIAENQEEFIEILQDPVMAAGGAPAPAPAPGMPSAPAGVGAAPAGQPQDPVAAMLAAMQAAAGSAGAAPGAAAAPAAPAAAAGAAAGPVQLSAADEAAVGRLVGLGFDRAAVVQAYLACERNEELAANYLFEAAEEN